MLFFLSVAVSFATFYRLQKVVFMLAVFLDIETTGLDPLKHRAIDIAFHIVDLTTQVKKKFYHSVITQSKEIWDARDPSSTLINGFLFEELLKGKEPRLVLEDIKSIFAEYQIVRGHALFICQNPAFDRSFFSQLIDISTQESLLWPYHWLDLASMYFALKVTESLSKGIAFPENITLSKNSIAESFKIPPEGDPHRASGGVAHLIKCYEALFGIQLKEQ